MPETELSLTPYLLFLISFFHSYLYSLPLSPNLYWLLTPGFWISNSDYWLLNFGLLDSYSWILNFRFWLLAPGFWLLNFWLLAPEFGSWIFSPLIYPNEEPHIPNPNNQKDSRLRTKDSRLTLIFAKLAACKSIDRNAWFGKSLKFRKENQQLIKSWWRLLKT